MKSKKKNLKELDVIAKKEMLKAIIPSDFNVEELWITAFKAGYLYIRSRGICKPIDVFHNGLLICNAKSLPEAYIASGVSVSHISRLARTKQKSKAGYSFKPGK